MRGNTRRTVRERSGPPVSNDTTSIAVPENVTKDKVKAIIKSEDTHITDSVIEDIINDIQNQFNLSQFLNKADFNWSLDYRKDIEPSDAQWIYNCIYSTSSQWIFLNIENTLDAIFANRMGYFKKDASGKVGYTKKAANDKVGLFGKTPEMHGIVNGIENAGVNLLDFLNNGFVSFLNRENSSLKIRNLYIDKIFQELREVKDFLNDDLRSILEISNQDITYETISLLLVNIIKIGGINGIISLELAKKLLAGVIIRTVIINVGLNIKQDKDFDERIINANNFAKKFLNDDSIKHFAEVLQSRRVIFLFITLLYNLKISQENLTESGLKLISTLNFYRNLLGISISFNDYSKYNDSGISKIINPLSNERKIFILKIIFRNISLFIKKDGTVSENLVNSLIEVEENRFEDINSFFGRGIIFNFDNLIFILNNKLEKKSNKVLAELIELNNAGVSIEILNNISEENLKELLSLKRTVDSEFFKRIIQAIVSEGKNIKEKVDLYLRVKGDLEKLGEGANGYDDLQEVVTYDGFFDIDIDNLRTIIDGIYERFNLNDVLNPKIKEEIKEEAISGEEKKLDNNIINVYPEDLYVYIEELDLNDESNRLIARIGEYLSDEDTKVLFVGWLNIDTKQEDLQKLLNILQILKDLKLSNIIIEPKEIIEFLVNDLMVIDVDYLRNVVSIIKEKNINGRIKEELLKYLITGEKGDLDDYIGDYGNKIKTHEIDDYISKLRKSSDNTEIDRIGEIIEKFMDNLFLQLDPVHTTSTQNYGFGTRSGSFMRSIRGIIFGKFKKTEKESYNDYLGRIFKINLKRDYIQVGETEQTRLSLSVIAKRIRNEETGIFYFLENFSKIILEKVDGIGESDFSKLITHYNQLISEQFEKLKRSLNI